MKYILISLLLLSGCISKIPTLTPRPNSAPPVQQIEFTEVDLNKDGTISKEEFATLPSEQGMDTQTPIIWFVILIVLIGSMVYMTKFLRK